MSAINNGFDVAHLLMHSALDELSAANTFCVKINDINITNIEEPDCFFVSPRIEGMDTSIKKHLIKAIVLFQSGMESIIHWIQNQDSTIKSGRSFAQKWENALDSKNVDFDFSDYKIFYENYPIHLVHPDKDERFETFNNLTFSDVYYGINKGWQAYAAMSDAIGYKHDSNSWQIMCSTHTLPETLDGINYVIPNELIVLLNKKYRKYLDKISS